MLLLRPTRLLAIGGIVLLAFLYWRPAQTYLHTKRQLEIRRSQVRSLREERAHLERQIALSGTSEQLVREARRLGLVKPGERLFIVKGISDWRKHH